MLKWLISFFFGGRRLCVCGGGILYCIYIIIWLSLLLLRMHGKDSLSLNYYLLASLTSLTRLIHDLELDGNHAQFILLSVIWKLWCHLKMDTRPKNQGLTIPRCLEHPPGLPHFSHQKIPIQKDISSVWVLETYSVAGGMQSNKKSLECWLSVYDQYLLGS